MNYKRIYWNLIRKAVARQNIEGTRGIDYEMHHVIPKSQGGATIPCNTIKLTVREHLMAHALLVRGFNMTTCLHDGSTRATARNRIAGHKRHLEMIFSGKQRSAQTIAGIPNKSVKDIMAMPEAAFMADTMNFLKGDSKPQKRLNRLLAFMANHRFEVENLLETLS